MAKVDLELVKRILKRRTELENDVLTEIMGELQSAIEEDMDANEEPKAAPIKKQFIIVVADNDSVLTDHDLVGWILQMPEDEPMQSVKEKIMRTAKSFNLSKKGRRFPVETVGETCESVPGRIFKENKLWLKTKEPVLLVPMVNRMDLDNVELATYNEDFSDSEESFSE